MLSSNLCPLYCWKFCIKHRNQGPKMYLLLQGFVPFFSFYDVYYTVADTRGDIFLHQVNFYLTCQSLNETWTVSNEYWWWSNSLSYSSFFILRPPPPYAYFWSYCWGHISYSWGAFKRNTNEMCSRNSKFEWTNWQFICVTYELKNNLKKNWYPLHSYALFRMMKEYYTSLLRHLFHKFTIQ